jgi:argininosuccinate lyase
MRQDSPKKYSFQVRLGSHDGRLKKEPAPEVVDYLYSRWLQETIPSFEEMTLFLKAHLVELHDKKVISPEDAAKILQTLEWLKKKGLDSFKLDPSIEDLMPNLEAIVISKIGESAGGRILTGMARGEPTYVSAVLLLRKSILDMIREMNLLRGEISKIGQQHTETLMPGYTHVQHAQPTTLGHFFACVAEALETDCARIKNAFERVNMCPAGYSSAWGTTYPTDRRRISGLLGFEAPIDNTRYAMLSFDRGIETLAALAMLAININRLTDDLYFWCTYEFNMADIADEFASTSYIMPQKKNPYALEEYPSLSNRVLSEFTRVAELTRLTSFGLGIHLGGKRTDTTMTPSRVIRDICGALKMLRGILSTMKFKTNVMRERVGIHFTQGTDLADTLVRQKGLSFRTAHKIIGVLVRQAIDRGLKPYQLDVRMLDQAAKEVIGRPLKLAPKILAKALDPMEGVKARKGIGGVAPSAVKRSFQNRLRRLDKDEAWLSAKEEKISRAEQELEKEARRVMGA